MLTRILSCGSLSRSKISSCKGVRTISWTASNIRNNTVSSTQPTQEQMRLSRFVCLGLLPAFSANSSKVTVQAFSIKPRDGNNSLMTTITTSSTVAASTATDATETSSPSLIDKIKSKLENSWVEQLSPETNENLQKSRDHERLSDNDNNRTKRPVYNGHYVLVKPTGLKNPRLLLWSEDLASQLDLSKEDIEGSDDFVNYVSGNGINADSDNDDDDLPSWATPYALSIVGQRYTSNCPYGTGNGYGDGRAISIGEFNGYELQLKGAGKTPFHRGADGRAVLRSSIREFLASEAMHFLGVPTTRALSLVVSSSDTVQRPWYSSNTKLELPWMNDPRIAHLSDDRKRMLMNQLRNEKADPDRLITEACAITCRASKSFVRIGHIDLFARRAERKSMENAERTNSRYDTTTNEWKELEDIIWHACYREYKEDAYDPFHKEDDIASAATVLLEKAADKLSTMVSSWIRVGFAQGNFNADNCLVGGYTMDYGPFGFLEEYNPLFAKWTGSGQHFGFMNQPNAGFANYQVLVESVVPVICAARNEEDPVPTIQKFMNDARDLFEGKVDETIRQKLGFDNDNEQADTLWTSLDALMRLTRADWTLFWRQLSYVAKEYSDYESNDYEAMLSKLIGEGTKSPFYEELTPEHRSQFLEWIKRWRDMHVQSKESGEDVAKRMLSINPKYVLREWILVDAYSTANIGEEEILRDVYDLIQKPYDEGTAEQEELYYRRAPEEVLMAGGIAFMS